MKNKFIKVFSLLIAVFAVIAVANFRLENVFATEPETYESSDISTSFTEESSFVSQEATSSTEEAISSTEEESSLPSHTHTTKIVKGTKPTYLKEGKSDGSYCSSCGEILEESVILPKLVLGKTAKVTASNTVSSIKLTWSSVEGASGYRIYYWKNGSWKKCATVTQGNTVSFSKLTDGEKYRFGIRAYRNEGKIQLVSPTYTIYETATLCKATEKISLSHNTTAIKLTWVKSNGASGYYVYRKISGKWKVIADVKALSYIIYGLENGTAYDLGVRPYVKTENGNVLGKAKTLVAATSTVKPDIVIASSTGKGCLDVVWSTVPNADGYYVYYKSGNGKYKLYGKYKNNDILYFDNLKSGKEYTFAVRGVKKITGGYALGEYKTATVKIK